MTAPIPTEQLVHTSDCPGPKITRKDAIGYSALSCSTCGAHARVPLRREWADRG
ncbi:hypothetical protein NF556_11575 [Ornithinimicrobium faecis]|uniref:Uncharacterized protein n=1 Tax=Ornithinimicrobium faecis TaxID=2934158 RepID=A0ABY4YNK3_9MICO|nr:hypothetical protein [Ornithinimicrobium sp. HY1793]USQ78293.1 hypothetical protein NF556_11575 [Ornithinimicrobium sp. HY1793]